MFENRIMSLGELDDHDRNCVITFLRGSAWEEIFSWEGEDMQPPDWLVEWSESWDCETVFTVEETDPYVGECLLIRDGQNKEVWASVYQGGDGVSLHSIPASNGEPDPEYLCSFFLEELEKMGCWPIVGNLSIGSPRLLPRAPMEGFLRRTMEELEERKIGNLTLEEWLTREYA